MDFKVTPLKNSTPAVPNHTRRNRLIVALGSLALIGVVVFALTQGSFSQSGVELKIDGPTEIAAGEVATYSISYVNHNDSPLLHAKLTFFYPDNAIAVKDGAPVKILNDTVNIGQVDKTSQKAEFQAYVIGDKGNIRTARAKLTYSVEGLGPVFEKEATIGTTISSLNIPLTLNAPPTAQNGQSITYILDYRNQSSEDKSDLRVRLKYPQGFRPQQSTPTPNVGNDTWNIKTLAQGDGGRISVTGLIIGNQSESRIIVATLERKITTPSGDVFIEYETTQAETRIAAAPLSLRLTVNNSKDYVAHLADQLEYAIDLANNANSDILGLTLSAKLTGSMFEPGTVESSGFFDSQTNTIAWNASSVPALSDLKPGQSVRVPFKVKVKKSFAGASGSKNSFIKVAAHLETNNVPPELARDTLTADDEVTTRISSAPSFDQTVFLQDNVFGSSGPFPMRVNQKTNFTVHWIITNPSSDITGARATVALAPGVVWENKARSADGQPLPTYNSRTNTVSWDLPVVPVGAGVSGPRYEGVFVISLAPSINQAGSSPKLLGPVTFTGTDSFTKEKISITIRELTTADVADSRASTAVEP